jgi:hypothetical protein
LQYVTIKQHVNLAPKILLLSGERRIMICLGFTTTYVQPILSFVAPHKTVVAMGSRMITLALPKTSAPRFALRGSVRWVQAIAPIVLILSATLTVGGRHVVRIT